VLRMFLLFQQRLSPLAKAHINIPRLRNLTHHVYVDTALESRIRSLDGDEVAFYEAALGRRHTRWVCGHVGLEGVGGVVGWFLGCKYAAKKKDGVVTGWCRKRLGFGVKL